MPAVSTGIVFDQGSGRARDEDLTSVGGGSDPGRAVNVESYIPFQGLGRCAGMDADSTPGAHRSGPTLRSDSNLDFVGGLDRVHRAAENTEETIAFGRNDLAVVIGDGSVDYRVVEAQKRWISVAKLLHEGCGVLQVCEQKRQSALGITLTVNLIWCGIRLRRVSGPG